MLATAAFALEIMALTRELFGRNSLWLWREI
jgi:hypothetical protein